MVLSVLSGFLSFKLFRCFWGCSFSLSWKSVHRLVTATVLLIIWSLDNTIVTLPKSKVPPPADAAQGQLILLNGSEVRYTHTHNTHTWWVETEAVKHRQGKWRGKRKLNTRTHTLWKPWPCFLFTALWLLFSPSQCYKVRPPTLTIDIDVKRVATQTDNAFISYLFPVFALCLSLTAFCFQQYGQIFYVKALLVSWEDKLLLSCF